MAKGTISKADRINAEAEAFNAAQEAKRTDADTHLIASVNGLIEMQRQESLTRETKRQNIGAMLIDAAKLGMSRDDFKTLFSSHQSWPKENNNPVSENKARKTPAGDAWNSVSVTIGRYRLDKQTNMPLVETHDGKPCLVKTGKETHESFGAGSPTTEKPTAPTFDVLSVITAIQDKLTPAEFDKIRSELDIIAHEFNQQIPQIHKAA